MKTKIISLLLISISANFLSAQDSIVNRNVTVEREYQPIIYDAGKIISTPKEMEITLEKTKPVYSGISTPLNIESNIQTLDAEELKHLPNPYRKGFARIGLGYPANTLADFMYPLYKDENNRLDLTLRHLGAFGDKMHSKTTANLQFNHLFSSFNIFAGTRISHDIFNYYGKTYGKNELVILSDIASTFGSAYYNNPENETISLYNLSGYPLKDTHWRFNAFAGASSLPTAESLNYNISMNYNLFKETNNKITENQMLLKGSFDVPYEDNRLGMDVEIHNLSYNNDTTKGFDIANNFVDKYSVLKFNPYYKINGDNWYLRLGVKMGISTGQGRKISPSPDVTAQWNAIPEYLAIYGGLTGDLRISTLSLIYDENRYLTSSIRPKDLYTPIDAFLGVKLSPTYNLMLDFYGDYKQVENQYFYVNRSYNYSLISSTLVPANLETLYHNRFDLIYADASRLSAGFRGSYDYKNQLNIYLKGAYHYWKVNNEAHAWQMPAWDMDFGANMKVGNNISLSTQFIFQDGRYAKLGSSSQKMHAITDLNLGASYAYLDWLSVFMKLNNVLNSGYDTYYGYQVQGINMMIGAAFSF